MLTFTNSNNILIITGAPGVGKSYELENNLDIQGKLYDLDILKDYALKISEIKDSEINFLNKQWINISHIEPPYNLSNPQFVGFLAGKLNSFGKKWFKYISNNMTHNSNYIYNISGSSKSSLDRILINSKGFTTALYLICPSIELTLERNSQRERHVDELVIVQTYIRVIQTFLNYNKLNLIVYVNGKPYLENKELFDNYLNKCLKEAQDYLENKFTE